MKLVNFYQNLRNQMLDAISGIENSDIYSEWDTTTPNRVTRAKLDKISTDNKPRSAIREYLLRAIIKINEEIYNHSSRNKG